MPDSIISVHDLRKIYRVGELEVAALRGANLEVPRGEFLAIVGPSGSGKSTLFHILGGLAQPTSGTVIVDGEDLASLTDSGRTRLRPVIMTALAMIIGMLPMALGFGEGGEQNAPLGRAVIGPVRQLDCCQGGQGLLPCRSLVHTAHEQRQLHVLHRAQDRQQIVHLEDETHLLGPVIGLLVIAHVAQTSSADAYLAFVELIQTG